jgi:hypothetical protein
MIHFQIVERPGAELQKRLITAMRDRSLRTFVAKKRGRRVQHISLAYPGWMSWSERAGVICCEVISPHKPGREWLLFSAFLGRLADRYAEHIIAINVQFPQAAAEPRTGRRRRRPS